MILVLAGTMDGRDIACRLTQAGYSVLASVVSSYGQSLIEGQNIHVHTGQLAADDLIKLISTNNIRLVVDATHPYATAVSTNAISACKTCGILYLRYERPTTPIPSYPKLHVVNDYQTAAALAARLGNTIFLTTGSRRLEIFKQANSLSNHRLIARVLPDAEVMGKCFELGFTPADIVALQGPFSHQLNVELFRHYNSDVIITKNSGDIGGSDTKLSAAMHLNIHIVMINRPAVNYETVVYSYEDLLNILNREAI